MANARGHYGAPRIGSVVGASTERGGDVGKWVFGIAGVVGVLWTHYQSKQIAALYRREGLPYQTYADHLVERGKSLGSRARSKIHELSAPRTTKKGVL